MDLREQVRAQRNTDKEREARERAERKENLTRQLTSTLGEEVVAALPELEYVDGISPLFKFCFGRLQFLMRRDYQHGGFDLIPTRGQSKFVRSSEQFYRALGEFEEEAFSEDQD